MKDSGKTTSSMGKGNSIGEGNCFSTASLKMDWKMAKGCTDTKMAIISRVISTKMKKKAMGFTIFMKEGY